MRSFVRAVSFARCTLHHMACATLPDASPRPANQRPDAGRPDGTPMTKMATRLSNTVACSRSASSAIFAFRPHRSSVSSSSSSDSVHQDKAAPALAKRLSLLQAVASTARAASSLIGSNPFRRANAICAAVTGDTEPDTHATRATGGSRRLPPARSIKPAARQCAALPS
jgi:hypothetical protein